MRDAIPPGSVGVDLVTPDFSAVAIRIVDASSSLPIDDPWLGWRRSADERWCEIQLPRPDQRDEAGCYAIELPLGPCELLAREDELDYYPALRRDLVVRAADPIERIELAFARGLELELRLREGVDPIPREFAVLLLEESAWDDVRARSEPSVGLVLDGGDAFPGNSLLKRRVHFRGDERTVTLRGLAPGRHRFKALPEGIAIEPAEVVLREGANRPIEIAWRR